VELKDIWHQKSLITKMDRLNMMNKLISIVLVSFLFGCIFIIILDSLEI